MSHPSRPQARGPARRRRRDLRIDTVQTLEERCLLAPFVTLLPQTATFTATGTPTSFSGNVTVPPVIAAPFFPTASPVTSVTLLTPTASFGGDIDRIEAGPGGDFGKAVYAISRGAGENTGAVNRPGV